MLRRLALGQIVGLTCFALGNAWADEEGNAAYRLWERGSKVLLPLDGGQLEVVFEGASTEAMRSDALVWIRASARAMTIYFGRFPVKRLALLILWREGSGIGHGTSWGYSGSIARVQVGRDSTRPEFKEDWVLVHEMIHCALPTLSRTHLWLEEGSATYVEPIARVQAGLRPAEETWAEFLRGMPRGLPEAGDQGLDRTHTWGRTYWGGALFYLLADLEMRRLSANRVGLQTALRAISRESQGNSADWDVRRFLSSGDKATGLNVLSHLYGEMAQAPITTDLQEMWRELGVEPAGGSVRFQEGAPEAAIRRALTQSPG